MNTTLYRSITHPPDTEDHLVLQIPAPGDLRELGFADRLSLRVGLWLLEKSQRPKTVRTRLSPPADQLFLNGAHLTTGESKAVFEYHLMRQLR